MIICRKSSVLLMYSWRFPGQKVLGLLSWRQWPWAVLLLYQIVKSGESGLIVERENPQQASEAMETLVNDETLRVTLAQNGEKRVRELYDWDKNVEDMIEIYQEIVEERNV